MQDPVVVVGELGRDTPGLVNLTRLGDDSSGLLVQFARNSLVLTDDLAADGVVERLEEFQESGGDTLLFCSSARDVTSHSRSKSIARWMTWSPIT